MKKGSIQVVLSSFVVALSLIATTVATQASPPAGNFTQTYKEDFTSGTVSNTGTVLLYAQDPGHKTVYNTPILQTAQNQWRVGYQYDQPLPLNNYSGDTEKEGYTPNNVSVTADGLQIAIRYEHVSNEGMDGGQWSDPDPKNNYPTANPPNNYDPNFQFHFSSGNITTCQEWTQMYGYFEAKIQMPYGPGAGFWPAFWLVPDRGPNVPNDSYRYNIGTQTSDCSNEIDIVEYMSSWQNATSPYAAHASSTVHFTEAQGDGSGNYNTGSLFLTNPEGGFHTYGVYWGPGVCHFYIDNVDVFDVASSRVSSTPSYMILNCGVTDNNWSTMTNITEAQNASYCPAAMLVKYVYAYQGRLAPPTTDLLLNATMTASSSDIGQTQYGAAYDPFAIDYVVDGVNTSDGTSNGWRSDTGAQSRTEWLQADMGASYQINTVTLYPRTDQSGANFPVNFTISTSTDGTSFTPVITKTSYPAPGSSPQTFTFPATTARYVKVTGTLLSIDPSDSTYRMAFAEIAATNNPNATTGTFVDGGIYTFAPQSASGSLIESAGSINANNGNPVDLWEANGGANQEWKAHNDGNGVWEFEVQSAPGTRLDVQGATSNANGTLVDIYASNGGNNQKFQVIEDGGGVVELQPLSAPGSRIEVPGFGAANGTQIDIYSANGGANQKLAVTLVSGGGPFMNGGIYTFTPQNATGSVLDSAGATTNVDGNPVELYTANGGANQQWKAYDDGGGVWEFEVQSAPGKRLDVQGANANANGTLVDIYTANGGDNQKFKVYDDGGGVVELQPLSAPNSRIEVPGFSTTNGTQIDIYTANGGSNQKFGLTRIQ